MTNRAESDAQHRSAWEAIPWLVNGSAGDAQRRSVEAHVRDCDDCRAEGQLDRPSQDGRCPRSMRRCSG